MAKKLPDLKSNLAFSQKLKVMNLSARHTTNPSLDRSLFQDVSFGTIHKIKKAVNASNRYMEHLTDKEKMTILAMQ